MLIRSDLWRLWFPRCHLVLLLFVSNLGHTQWNCSLTEVNLPALGCSLWGQRDFVCDMWENFPSRWRGWRYSVQLLHRFAFFGVLRAPQGLWLGSSVLVLCQSLFGAIGPKCCCWLCLYSYSCFYFHIPFFPLLSFPFLLSSLLSYFSSHFFSFFLFSFFHFLFFLSLSLFSFTFFFFCFFHFLCFFLSFFPCL